jgi:hypothetical protein
VAAYDVLRNLCVEVVCDVLRLVILEQLRSYQQDSLQARRFSSACAAATSAISIRRWNQVQSCSGALRPSTCLRRRRMTIQCWMNQSQNHQAGEASSEMEAAGGLLVG